MKQPPNQPRLTSLRSFTAIYYQIDTTTEVTHFSKWVRRAIAGSPHLEELHLVHGGANQPDPVAYDGLVDSVIKKHWATLRILDLGAAVVSIRKLKEMLSGCLQLEEISITVDKSVLVSPELFLSAMVNVMLFREYSLLGMICIPSSRVCTLFRSD